MQVHQVGEGTPEVAVVGAVHGDEPCGVRAVERLLAESPAVERPVKLVVANEAALADGVRYVDEDLNRAFPGDPRAETHEGRLAHDLAREVRDCTTLAVHSTRSWAEPFAVVRSTDAVTRGVCPRLPVDAVVETDAYTEGRLVELPHVLEVEAGRQGTPGAAENAYRVTLAFLAATGVLGTPGPDLAERPGDGATVGAGDADASGHGSGGGEPGRDPDGPREAAASGRADGRDGERAVSVFRLREPIPKPPAERYEVFAENFTEVPAGEAYAAADGEPLVASESFYPVLLSADGYETQFGYAADRVGVVGGNPSTPVG
jgi:hypothetical protein